MDLVFCYFYNFFSLKNTNNNLSNDFYFSFSTSLSLKAEGIRSGITFRTIGSNTAPPGNIKMAKEGIDFTKSLNCVFTASFSSLLNSVVVDLRINCTNSLLCLSSTANLSLFRPRILIQRFDKLLYTFSTDEVLFRKGIVF